MSNSRWLCALIPALLVTACSVSEGNKPETMMIAPPEGDESSTETKAYVCVPRVLTLLLEFSDGEIGNFASRAQWTSSNPNVVAVSNGDIVIESTEDDETPLYYASGTLIAKKNGTARITAEYLDFTDYIDVRVGQTGKLSLDPEPTRLAPETSERYVALATLDGVEFDVSGFVSFSLEEENDEVATLASGTSTITAVAPGGPLKLLADFPYCDQTLSTPITVANATDVTIAREEGFEENLILGTTVAFTAMADFGDGPEQDVSDDVDWLVSDTDIARFANGYFLRGDRNGEATVRARLGNDDSGTVQPEISSTGLPVKVVNGTLNSIKVLPKEPSIYPLSSVQLTATGTYNDGARVQDITRHVIWRSSDTTELFVPSGISDTAGLVTSLKDRASTVAVVAEEENATEQTTSRANVTVDPSLPLPGSE